VRWKMLTAQLCGVVCGPISDRYARLRLAPKPQERMSERHDLEDDFVR